MKQGRSLSGPGKAIKDMQSPVKPIRETLRAVPQACPGCERDARRRVWSDSSERPVPFPVY